MARARVNDGHHQEERQKKRNAVLQALHEERGAQQIDRVADHTAPIAHDQGPAGHGGRVPDLARFIHMDGDGPRFGTMIGLVALIVATVILVFFGIGYALGRLFL